MKTAYLSIIALFIIDYTYAQNYYVKPVQQRLTISTGINLQYLLNAYQPSILIAKPRPSVSISYKLQLRSIFSIEPEISLRQSYQGMVYSIGQTTKTSSVYKGEYEGLSALINIPLNARIKRFEVGLGPFLELPISLNYRTTVYPNGDFNSPIVIDKGNINGEWIQGWLTSLTFHSERYRVRFILSQRTHYEFFKPLIAPFRIIDLSVGYKF